MENSDFEQIRALINKRNLTITKLVSFSDDFKKLINLLKNVTEKVNQELTPILGDHLKIFHEDPLSEQNERYYLAVQYYFNTTIKNQSYLDAIKKNPILMFIGDEKSNIILVYNKIGDNNPLKLINKYSISNLGENKLLEIIKEFITGVYK